MGAFDVARACASGSSDQAYHPRHDIREQL
jgi:hypothetical protein